MKKYGNILFVAICLLSNISCGIIEYQYLEPVTNVTTVFNTTAHATLPDGGAISFYFSNERNPYIVPSGAFRDRYEIYYKIYVSSMPNLTAATDADRTAINPQLQSNYASLDRLTQAKTSVGINTFRDMGFYLLGYDSANNLVRSNGNGAFTIKPSDGYFVNSNDLTAEISTTLNADVEKNSSVSGGSPYTYAALYIVRYNFNDQTLSPIYSAPALISIFFLPFPAGNNPITGLALVNGETGLPISTSTPPIQVQKGRTFVFQVTITPVGASNSSSLIPTSSDDTIAKVVRDPDNDSFDVIGVEVGGPVTITVEVPGTEIKVSFQVQVTPTIIYP